MEILTPPSPLNTPNQMCAGLPVQLLRLVGRGAIVPGRCSHEDTGDTFYRYPPAHLP